MAAKSKKTHERHHSIIMTVLFISAAVIFIISIIALKKEINESRQEVAVLQSQCDEQEAENAELQSMIDSGDQDEYMEKRAREDGYIMPGDRVYQDIASGE